MQVCWEGGRAGGGERGAEEVQLGFAQVQVEAKGAAVSVEEVEGLGEELGIW